MESTAAVSVEVAPLRALLQELSAELGAACRRAQLWVDDDRGLHPRASLGGPVSASDRALARQCSLQAQVQVDATRAGLPVGLSDRRIGALVVEFDSPINDAALDAIQAWIAAQRRLLDQHLAHDRLARLSGGARRAEALRAALTAAHALEAAASTSKAFATLHHALCQLMSAENFFVVLLDEQREWLHFEYYRDDYDQISSWEPLRFLEGRLQGVLSAIVVASARVLRGHTEELLEKAGHGDTAADPQFGPNAADWIGVPMLTGEEAIGALVVQNYTPGFRYGDADPGILSLLAEACAAALQRRRVQQTLQRIVAERTAELEASLQQLRSAQQQLVAAEKHAALGRLVAGVAHELNTPLGICVTAASHLDDASRGFAAQQSAGPLRRSELDRFLTVSRDSSQMLSSNLERMARLVNRFRQIIAAVDAHPARRLPLADWLQGWADSQRARLQVAGHQLRCQLAVDGTVSIRAGLLSEVLDELLDNALQHAIPESPAASRRLDLLLEAAYHGERIELRLADNGCGLPQDAIPLLFDPFYTTARHRGQVGLGLHRVHILVSQVLGGTIRAERRPVGGSVFVLQLPRDAG